MAYINVAEWSPDQVTDWLKGLDNSMYKYINSFANNEIKGQTLLNIRPYELNELGIISIGHQEIVLEAVEQLRNFNYDLEKENLQFLALRVATTAKNLHHQLAYYSDKSKVETQILNDITRAIGTIKPLVGWLDRSPFQGQLQFNEIRKRILCLGIEMATSAQRDRFVENPVDQIRLTAEKLSKLADYIIQDISDPIILQPATLNLVTLKKRESELGFNIVPNYHGIHVITDIKYNSPAHISGKIEDGDEIIQINYQTVVGWHYKRVLRQLQESPPDVLLTLKKRPRHTKIYGQIYMKPYRLPSKKRALPYRFGENLPSPRIEFIPSQNFPVLLPLTEKGNISDSDSSSSDNILIPDETTKSNEKELRLYLPKPRAVLQRRNTICGDQASGFRGNITFWHEMNIRRNIEGNNLRDKSVSFGFGLEISSDKRPITCIGIQNKEKYSDFGNALKGSLPDIKSKNNNEKESIVKSSNNDVNDNMIPQWKDVVCSLPNELKSKNDLKSKVVKFNSTQDIIEYVHDSNIMTEYASRADTAHDPAHNILQNTTETHEKTDKETEKETETDKDTPITEKSNLFANKLNPANSDLVEAINSTLIKSKKMETGRTSPVEDKPPEIGPRKEFLKKIAPKPPPRPSKAAELVQRKFESLKQERPNKSLDTVQTPESPNNSGSNMCSTLKYPKANEVMSSNFESNAVNNEEDIPIQKPSKPMFSTYNNSDGNSEESELLTPNRTKTLTLKKKNSILAKRRKIGLKTLEFADIQGHLFRRTKDKHGVTYWAKLYFVLVETALYGFRNKKSQKANCLIFLPGFTISLATEVHSKSFAYKVYHQKKTFYFAAESQQALDQWMDYIKRATLKCGAMNVDPMLVDTKELFSETDSSEDENESHIDDPPHSTLFKKSVLGKTCKKRGSLSESQSPVTQTKSEKYHLGFGSLKKFTNLHNLPFSSNKNEKEDKEKKKNQSDIPVPTEQYRSYRKIPGNAGMQLGSNSLVDYNMMANRLIQNNVLSSTPLISPVVINESNISKINESEGEIELKSNAPCSTAQSDAFTLPSQHLLRKEKKAKPIEPNLHSLSQVKNLDLHVTNRPISKLSKSKTSPFNYMHASNPNLVEFTFQTSKNLDVGLPKVNVSNIFDQHQNLQGFITLKDLMLQREEDEAHNMYNNRVNLGVEKPSDRLVRRKHRRPNDVTTNENNRSTDDNENTPQTGQKPNMNKIQRRSLPKTPDYAQSFKTDDSEIIMARSKEGQKLRDFGYEFISGDDINNENNKLANIVSNCGNTIISQKSSKPAVLAKTNERFILPTKRKGLNWIGLNLDSKRHEEEKMMNKGSFKIIKPKHSDGVELNRIKYDNVFYAPSAHNKINKCDPPNSSILNEDRKFSAPYLSKLAFPTKTVKEKRLLGSPRLHRAASSIFGRKNIENPTMDQPIIPTFDNLPNTIGSSNACGSSTDHVVKLTNRSPMDSTTNEMCAMKSTPIISSSDQNFQYPPVFVPETYSLRDPNSNQ